MIGACEICGDVGNLQRHRVALWDYGHRNIYYKLMCRPCRNAEDSGEL
jgi:hypothetical protein